MPTDRLRFTLEGRRTADVLLEAFKLGGLEVTQPQLVKTAVCYSLAESGPVEPPPGFKEARGYAFDQNRPQRDGPLQKWGAQKGDIFLPLTRKLYGRYLDREEALSLLEYHLHLGIARLAEAWHSAGGNAYEFLSLLHDRTAPAGEVPEEGMRAVGPIILDVGEVHGELSQLRWNHRDTGNLNAAFVGSSGMGKTQFALDLIRQVREQSGGEIQVIILDYKGDIAENTDFLQSIEATTWDPTTTPLPLNPFATDRADERSVHVVAERLADLLTQLDGRIGPIQRNLYRLAVEGAYARRKGLLPPWPDFRLVEEELARVYDEQGKELDSLREKTEFLSRMQYFASVSDAVRTGRDFPPGTHVVTLRNIEGRKDEVAFFVLESLRARMRRLPDSLTRDGWRQVRTLLFIDEAHHYLRKRSRVLDELLREGRSRGYGVWLATQGVEDLGATEVDYALNLAVSFLFQTPQVEARQLRRMLRGLAPQDVANCAAQVGRVEAGRCYWMPPGSDRPQLLHARQFYK